MIKWTELSWRSPLDAFRPLARREGSILLHGGALAAERNWSFVAAAPSSVVEWRRGDTYIDGRKTSASPFAVLAALHAERRLAPSGEIAAPLSSGLIGFAGYECARLVEPAVPAVGSHYRTPDLWFGAYDAVAAFNCGDGRAFVYGRSDEAIARLRGALGETGANGIATGTLSFIGADRTRDDYCSAVAEIIERIRAGELFQANISQRLLFEAADPFDPYALFCAASLASSASFGAYLQLAGAEILSLSPERFFAATSGPDGRRRIVAEPIKGTRPRGATSEDDAKLRAALAADPKDRAENVMIADLTRNDLSRICEDGSIREEAICDLVSHANIHHLVSRISGALKPDVTAVDALASMFPCGSITGAPKIEAMKAIAAIEGRGRGPYCGAIGYIDDRGGADFAVAIRIAVVEGRAVTVPVGGGITLRSDPQAEYDETLAKAAHWLRREGV
jgi:para-aminobenzoate synthetase component 1